MQPLRVGLIGNGYAGATIHVPLIPAVDGLRLVRIATARPDSVALPGVDAVATPTQLIEAADIDLVVIATPNTTHADLARQALLAGKHVVLEKPFTVTSAEAQELLRIAAAKQRVLSVFHNRRWDSDFLTLRRCIDAGLLGEVHSYQAHFNRYRPQVRARWREQDIPGSGALYDLGSHLIDQALVLFGMPSTVTAHVATQRTGGQAVDYFHLLLGYRACKVVLESGAVVREPGPRFQVHGSRGSFIKSGFDPQEEALKLGRRPGDAGFGEEDAASAARLVTDCEGLALTATLPSLAGDYAAFYRGMRDAILHGGPVPVPGGEALNVIRLIELALQSHLERRSVPCTPAAQPTLPSTDSSCA